MPRTLESLAKKLKDPWSRSLNEENQNLSKFYPQKKVTKLPCINKCVHIRSNYPLLCSSSGLAMNVPQFAMNVPNIAKNNWMIIILNPFWGDV